MNIRILICLIACLAAFTTCKKDNTTYFKGVVLHAKYKTPVEGAQVQISFSNREIYYINNYPRLYQPIQYTTTTNSQGEYEFFINDKGSGTEYVLEAKKEGLLQAYPFIYFNRRKDTIRLDVPSHLRVIVKNNQVLPAGDWYRLHCTFNFDGALNGPFGYLEMPDKWYVPHVPADTITYPFLYSYHNKAKITLYQITSNMQTERANKEVTLNPTTTDLIIE